MGNLYIDVYIVHIDKTFERHEPSPIGKVIGVAEDRNLYLLPSGGLGIYYQQEIKEVRRSSAGNLIATLSDDSWKKEDCEVVNSMGNFEFSPAEKHLELAVERYLDRGNKDNLPDKESSSDASSKGNADKGCPSIISKGMAHLSKDDRSIQKPSIYGPKTLYSLYFLPPKIKDEGLDRKIDEFDLSVRSSNALNANNVHTINDLLLFSEFTLSKLPSLGMKSVLEIKDLVHSLGLSLQEYDSGTREEIKSNPSLFLANEENPVVPDKLIREFELSARPLNVLSENKIHSVQDLMLLSENELRKMPNLGENSVREIIEFIVSLSTYKTASENFFDPDDPFFLTHVSKLDLSTRSLKCLKFERIDTIGDLVSSSKIDLLRNQGKKCINDIEKKLAPLGYSFDMVPMSRDPDNSASSHVQPKNIDISSIYPHRVKMEDWILELLPSKRPELLERLTGQLTLEAMGDKMNVTRERVRQLQVKYEAKFLRHKEIHIREINGLNLIASQPCHLFMLPIHSAYFDNIHKYIPNKNSFFIELFNDPLSRYRVEWIDGDSIVVQKNLPELEEVIDTIIKLNLNDDYDQYLISVQRTDLRDYIFERLKLESPKSNAGKTRERLRKIFDDSSCLISLSELGNILLEQFDFKAGLNEIGNAIKKLGDIYLFGPHGWGKEDKFSKLDQSERLHIQGLVIPILKARGGADIHTDDLLERVRDSNCQFFDTFEGKLDKYQLNWLLKKAASKNPKIKDKGRLVWGYGSYTKRKNVMAVAIDVLHKHGKPLATHELKKKILTQRSLGKNFQIRPSKHQPDLIQLTPNKWGLRNRDLPEITAGMETLLVDAILNHFEKNGPIIDSAKLTEIISGVGIDKNCSFFLVSRLLLRYTSSAKPEKSKPLRIHTSNKDENRVLIIDPEFKGKIPLI
ncbi:hypothetical protein N8840_00335 [Porticoccaceae bacterium]|nr:hypothetical protein [Porticoccaceae bacterium]